MGEGNGSTRIVRARFSLKARRALQTWQMTLASLLSNLTRCSSPSPSSRRRSRTSGAAESSLMQTVVPALTRLNGQTAGPAHVPSMILQPVTFLFTAQQDKLIALNGQAGFWPIVIKFCHPNHVQTSAATRGLLWQTGKPNWRPVSKPISNSWPGQGVAG